MKPENCKKCGSLCDKFILLYPYDVRPSLKSTNFVISAPCNAGPNKRHTIANTLWILYSHKYSWENDESILGIMNKVLNHNVLTLEEHLTLLKYKQLISSSDNV